MHTPPSSTAHLVVPILLGTMITCPLYGITIAQTVWYFRRYAQDSAFLKGLVVILLLLDGTQTISGGQCVKMGYLHTPPGLAFPQACTLNLYSTYFTIAIVQCTFTYRVWILSGRQWILTTVLAVLTFVEFASATGASIVAQHGSVLKFHSRTITVLGVVEIIATMACDVITAVSLAYHLHRWRSGLRKSDNLVDKLVRYVVGIGALTSVIATVDLVTFTMRQDLTFLAFHFVIAKFYVNSLLVMLNARQGFRSDIERIDYSLPLFTSLETPTSTDANHAANAAENSTSLGGTTL